MQVKIENHGNPSGLSWFVTVAGIESGPYTQAEALEQAGECMRAFAREVKRAERTADYVDRAEARISGMSSRQLLDAAFPGGWVSLDSIGAARRIVLAKLVDGMAEAARDYEEMRQVTGTRDGDPVPAWY